MTAQAQSRLAAGDAATGVAERSRPEYDPLGIRVGGFLLLPSTSVQLAHDSNVRSTGSGRIADSFVTVQPRLQLRSTWSQHSIALLAQGDIRRFADLKSENSEQARGEATGRLDVSRTFRIAATASAARLIEPRGTAGDTLQLGKPIAYRQLRGTLRANGEIGRIQLQAGGQVASFHYFDARIGGTRVPLAFRDYRRHSADVRVGYALGPNVALYAQGSANSSRYPDDPRSTDRGSHGYAVVAGVAFGVTDLISGEIGAGYLSQRFSDPAYQDVSGINYQLALAWNPTPLLSVTAEASRDVERAPFAGIGGVTNSDFRLAADYELLRQLILSAALGHVRDDYNDLDRVDRRYSAEVGGRYLVNRTLSLNAAASYRRQASSGDMRRRYAETVVRLGVTLRR